MADTSTDFRVGSGATSGDPRSRAEAPRAPFGPTLALIVTLAVGCFAALMPVILILHRPTVLPAPFPPQNQTAETLAYVLSFAVILPLALIVAPRLAGLIERVSGGAALSALAGLLAASLAVAILGIKLSGGVGLGDGVKVVLIVALLWWAATTTILARAARNPWPLLVRMGHFATPIWGVAALLVLAAVLCVAVLGSISPLGLVLGLAGGGGVLVAHDRLRLPRGRSFAFVADAVVVALLLLAVPDLVIFEPAAATSSIDRALMPGIIQFHQNFLLGPANDVLHGGAMLVDTASQYGVGTIYLLTGWFQFAPIGYGTFGLLDGVLTALWFCAGYAIVRMGGTPRAVAASALGIAVVALVFNLSYPVGALPQDGPLRFGLPMAVLLTMVAGERWPKGGHAARVATRVIVGISAIWSLEGFAYTLAVFAAVACLLAYLGPGPARLRWLARQGVSVVLACVCAHVLFATMTLAATGHLPDWGQYLSYLHEFLAGGLGDFTYDVARWTPGLAVGVAYATSAAALVELVRRRGVFVQRERVALIALCGLTAYGIVLLSYYVDRSQNHILMHVSLPAILMGAIWLGLLLRSRETVARGVRLGALAFGLAIGILVLSVAWSSIGPGFPRSALARAVPGGKPFGGSLRHLWHPPPLNRASLTGVRLLARYMPGQRRSLVIVAPDLGTEILLRSDRADVLFLGDPWEASFVADQRLPGLRKVLARVRPGERMLIDDQARKVLASPDPRMPSDLAPLQRSALKWLADRFVLQPIKRMGDFSVVELKPRPQR